jgi:hypothetical protein
MSAMNWLATQLAWEQRLVELRSGDRPAPAARTETRDAEVARQAA